jgi:hypothetical protein
MQCAVAVVTLSMGSAERFAELVTQRETGGTERISAVLADLLTADVTAVILHLQGS